MIEMHGYSKDKLNTGKDSVKFIQYPNGGWEKWTYNEYQTLNLHENSIGQWTRYEYDEEGRLSNTVNSYDQTTTYKSTKLRDKS